MKNRTLQNLLRALRSFHKMQPLIVIGLACCAKKAISARSSVAESNHLVDATVEALKNIDAETEEGHIGETDAASDFEANVGRFETLGPQAFACGETMKVKGLRPPWENMHAHVQGASDLLQCESCAKNLSEAGDLKPGWNCVMKRGNLYLSRKGELTLQPFAARKSFHLEDTMPLTPAGAPLPKSLRGIFWLSKQKTSSALVTFAPNNQQDCEWCSYGALIANWYLIRVSGACVWSFAEGTDSHNIGLAERLDLMYAFQFDDPTHPKHGHIWPHANGNRYRFLNALKYQDWILDLDVKLVEDTEKIKEMGFEGSVVWHRPTLALFKTLSVKPYDLIQVVDEHGNKIEPAWSKFVEYQKNPNKTGSTPGQLWYHACITE